MTTKKLRWQKKTKTINHDNKINELIAPGVAFAMTVNA